MSQPLAPEPAPGRHPGFGEGEGHYLHHAEVQGIEQEGIHAHVDHIRHNPRDHLRHDDALKLPKKKTNTFSKANQLGGVK